MYGIELKRILKSKVFIILALLTVVYFAFVMKWYFRDFGEYIKSEKTSAGEINACIQQYVDKSQSGDIEEVCDLIKEDAERLRQESMQSGADVPDGEVNEEYFELMNQYLYLSSCLDTINYQYKRYPQLVYTTLDKAYAVIEDPQTSEYNIRLSNKAIEHYNVYKDFSLVDTTPISSWNSHEKVKYEYFYLILSFVFVILAADVFCAERTLNLEGMVYTAKYGRKRLFVSKLLSLLTIAFAAVALLTASDIILANYCMGDLLFEPIQIIESYKSCVFNINILQFIILSNSMRLLFLVFVISIAAAVSQISGKVFFALMFSAILLAALTALFVYSSHYEVDEIINMETMEFRHIFYKERLDLFTKLRAFLPVCLSQPHDFFEKFDYINVANFPFLRLTTCVIVTTAVTVLLLLFAYFRFGNVFRILPRKNKISKGVDHNEKNDMHFNSGSAVGNAGSL